MKTNRIEPIKCPVTGTDCSKGDCIHAKCVKLPITPSPLNNPDAHIDFMTVMGIVRPVENDDPSANEK